jgi:O-antigen/teichoic acid export membrane protein
MRILNKSTVSSRIISGSVASWLKILVGFGSQILLVPIFLSAWDASTYGVWLLLAAVLGTLNLLALSYHDYVGFEALKVGNNYRKVSYLISSAIPINIMIGLLIVVIAILINLLGVGSLLNLSQEDNQQFSAALLISTFFLLLTTNISGFVERWLIPFGYYPFFAWIRVYRTIVTAVAPATTVFFGGDMIQAVLAMSIADLIFHLVIYWLVIKECKRNKYSLMRPRFFIGIKLWLKSSGLLLRYLIDLSRQMGVRLIMAPLVQPQQIAVFATIRSGANIGLQGMQSISAAILPELMRYVRDRDSRKIESTFSVFWVMVVFVLAPGILAIQVIMPSFFEFWTLGKLEFDAELFATLTLGVLIFAIAMPFEAIIRGQNLIQVQIIIASIAAVIAISGIYIFIPFFGLKAAGYSLLISEFVSFVLYMFYLNQWMLKNGLSWPKKQLLVLLFTLLIVLIGTYTYISTKNIWLILVATFVLIPISWIYWKLLPELVQSKIKRK